MTLTNGEAIIETLGGIGAVAALTGRNYDAVWVWKKNGKFPSNTFLVIQAALAERGLSASPALWSMAEQAAE